jgi:hypothetical protein
MARLKIVNSEHEWQLKQNIKSMDHLYKKYKLRSKKGIEESVVNESHFQVGDKVKMSHGGVGVVKSLDKEDGADDEKYYNIELPNGEVMKHAPNELTLSVNEGVSRDAAYIHGILQSGQDATQNFIDDNGLDGEKLSDYVKANRNNIDGYNVKHYISGERGTVGSVPKLRQAFIKKFKKGKSVNETSMSDIDIIAQESATFDEFVNNIKTDPDYKSVDVNDPEVKAFLQQMYDDSQEMNEVSGFTSGKQFIDIKLQKYPKALAKVNELITMIGESKFTMEMAEWLFDFFNNASFERPVSESKRAHRVSVKEEIRNAIRTEKA